MLKENFPTAVAVKTKTFVADKIIAVAIIISSLSGLFALGAYMTAPLWQNQVAITTQQQNSVADQQMNIIADSYNNYQPKLVLKEEFKPSGLTDEIAYHQGWPVDLPIRVGLNVYWPGIVSPVVDDLNNDGEKELVIIAQGDAQTAGIPSRLFIYSQQGQLIAEWESIDYEIHPDLTPSIADINNDGQKEILIFAFDWYNNLKKILIFNNQARIINSITTDYFLGGVFLAYKTYVISDINNDNNKEIIYAGFKQRIADGGDYLVVLDNNGHDLPGFPIQLTDWWGSGYTMAMPTVANLDSDETQEIVIASYNYTQQINNIRAFDYQGNLLWQQTSPDIIFNGLIAGDVNNDGNDEIIFPTRNGIFIIDKNGDYILQQNLPYEDYHTPPALGDLDNDGDLEIVFGRGTTMHVFHHTGESIAQFYTGNIVAFSVPLISDINNNGTPDIIFGQYNRIHAWNINGEVINGFPLVMRPNDALYATPTISDIDNNNDLELIVSTNDMFMHIHYPPMIYVWDLEGNITPQSHEWPMFAHDVRHTGNYQSSQ